MPRVLIADDEPNIVASVEFLMKKEGHQVFIAFDGNEALNLLSEKPDLIILDVMMPGRDGFDICHYIRHHKELSTMKILFLTARGREQEKTKGVSLGADAYMTKPFAIKDLVQKTRELLGAAS